MSASHLIRHAGRFTPEDRADGTWQYLPIDVPAGYAGLEVTLEYERIGGVLDLGCLDPHGWRGWSGGARSRFVITPDAATPGYLPGDLQVGTWHVVLGLYRIPEHGVGFEVTARLGDVTPAPGPALPPVPSALQRPAPRDLPAPDGLRWLAGDLHAHTTHSDGALTVDELACLAVTRGLDFCAVSDHNTTSHHALLPAASGRAGVTLLPAQEVTTQHGHANAFGDIGWVDFREPTAAWAETVAARNGLLSINHPIGGDCSWRMPVEGISYAEVWHGSWSDRHDGGALAWWAAREHAPIPLGGSDWHMPGGDAPLGSPVTWVAAEDDSVEAVLEGLRAGRTAITYDRTGPAVLRLGAEVVVVDGEGAVLLDPDGSRRIVNSSRWSVPAGPGPYVLETQDRVALALTR